jgi:hypothetical protein
MLQTLLSWWKTQETFSLIVIFPKMAAPQKHLERRQNGKEASRIARNVVE